MLAASAAAAAPPPPPAPPLSSSSSSSSSYSPCDSVCLQLAISRSRICAPFPTARTSSRRPKTPSLKIARRNRSRPPPPCLRFTAFRYAHCCPPWPILARRVKDSRFASAAALGIRHTALELSEDANILECGAMQKKLDVVQKKLEVVGVDFGGAELSEEARIHGHNALHHSHVVEEGVEMAEVCEEGGIRGYDAAQPFHAVEEDVEMPGFCDKQTSHEFDVVQKFNRVEEEAAEEEDVGMERSHEYYAVEGIGNDRSHRCNEVKNLDRAEGDDENVGFHGWNMVPKSDGAEEDSEESVNIHECNVAGKHAMAGEHVEKASSHHGCNVTKTFESSFSRTCSKACSFEARDNRYANLDLSSEEITHVLRLWQTGSTSIEHSIIIMQRCRKTKNLAYARSIHLHVCANGLSVHKAVENYIVPMFVDCGSLLDAHLVFHRLAYHKEHSWTSLILGHCEHGAVNRAFLLHKKMQEDGIDPSVHTIVGLLKTCTKLRDIEKGWKLHLEVLQQGLDRHSSIGAALIDMYSKCGMLTEASEVFNELTCQDVLAWSTLIAGYVERGPPNEVLNLFDRMRLVGITASSSILSGTFRACGALGTLSKGHELHTESVMMGLDRDVFVGTSLVCMYAKCGFVEDSREVFQRLPDRDVVSWNAQIAGYLDAGDGQEALNCFTAMKTQGMSPDSVTYSVSLKACGLLRSIARGREIHMEIMLAAIEKDLSISNSLIAMYAKCGFLSEAQHVARNMLVKDVSSWTSLIAGYADHGPAQEALDYIETMQLEGLSPDAVILACSLNACCLLGDLKEAQSKHADIVQRGFEEDSSVGSSLISMYAKLGAVAEAQNAFDKLRTRGVVEWTALATGYVEYGLHKEAMTCLDLMEQDGIAPNSVTFICALTACGNLEEAQRGQDIHTSIICRGLESGLQVGNSLIGMYGRCGLLLEAHGVFQKLLSKDTVSWNALISACVEQGLGQAALDVFDEMQMQGQAPDTVTFINILKACGDLGALDMGREIHMKLKGSGYELEPSLSNSAISMYAKCGSLMEAQEVFDILQVRDVVAWSSIIKAYGVNHEGEKAVQCFEDMEQDKVKPDAITFACLLLACSHSSLVHEGIKYFKTMREKYGVVPEAEHYTSIVDLLARSGRLYEAEQFVMIWCPASGAAWSALLSGCKTYGEVELGSRCFRQLVDTNADVATWYVLMADLYAMAGRWDDVMFLEGLRKHVGAAKRRASASIEVDKQVHEFVVGSNEHGYEKIVALLNSMSSSLKEGGHLPNLDLVLNSRADGAKDAALCEHAEKLALAFGLLCTSPGVTLRVSKNLRMCDDCHNTSKILSRVEKREIVLRDDCCIHRFKNGLCSCGDTF